MEVCPVQAIIPACKSVLNIGAERAADLRYTLGQQVRVKHIKDDSIKVCFDGFDARKAWINAGEVSITQAGTQPVVDVIWGEGSKSGTFSFEPPCLHALSMAPKEGAFGPLAACREALGR